MRKILFCLGLIVMLFTSCTKDGSGDNKGETYIVSPSCGSQLTDIYQSIFCLEPVIHTIDYRYRFTVTDEATGIYVGSIDTPKNSFSMADLGLNNLGLGKSYKIRMSIAHNVTNFNSINDYCTMRTPDLPGKSRVIIPQCGSIINSLWDTVFALQSLGAEKYRFVVTDGSQTREIETTKSSFQLPFLSGGAAANTQYLLRVDVLYQGTWYEGDELCSITTSPTATLRQSSSMVEKSLGIK